MAEKRRDKCVFQHAMVIPRRKFIRRGALLIPSILLTHRWTRNALASGLNLNGLPYYARATNGEVAAWCQRIINNGGKLPTGNAIRYVDWFVSGLRANSIFDGVGSVIVPSAGNGNVVAATTPILNSLGTNDPWTNINFVDADVTVNGLQPNGSTKYLKPGKTPAQICTWASGSNAFNSIGFSVYLNDGTATGNTCQFGSQSAGGSNDSLAWYPHFGGTNYWDCPYFGGTGRCLDGGNSFSARFGLCFAVRTSTTLQTPYNYNSVDGFTTGTTGAGNVGSQTPSALEVYAMAMNNNGSPSQQSDKRTCLSAIHIGWNATQAQNWGILVQNLLKNLGATVV